MKDMEIIYTEDISIDSPILVEGLPGVGNIGKIAADYLIEKLGARKIADIYSKFFPPQVLIGENGVLDLVRASLYYYDNKDGLKVVFLTGPYQAVDNRSHYEFVDVILDLAVNWNTKMIYTLGGYGTGKLIDEPRVLGAVTHEYIKKELVAAGVEFSKDEPSNGIVGASGLLLGMGKLRSLKGACLMGETSGYVLDPKGAKAIILALSSILNIEVDMEDLDKEISNLEFITEKLSEMEQININEKKKDLDYIG